MPQAARLQKWLIDWRVAVVICGALLLLRSWFFLAWEESYFHSDQAIVGLMAKHLVEGRSLPLFFYGQEYMLAVESWAAAPFLALFGPSVASLRAAMVAINLVTGLLLVRLLVRDAGLGVWPAVAASSPFWIAPVVLATSLMEAQGGNIEPFLWTLIVWMVRARPLSLGVVLAIAVLNREFSAYAAPMVAVAQLVEARASATPLRAVVLNWLATAAAFLIVFGAVQSLKPHADLMGPGTAGVAVATSGQDSLALAAQRIHLNAAELSARFRDVGTDFLPTLFGLKPVAPAVLALATDLQVGRHALAGVIVLLAAAALLLLMFEARALVASPRRWLFPLYLVGVGMLAVVVYALARPLSVFTLRYGLLVLYVPIGLAALMLQPVNGRALRASTLAALLLFAICSLTDHARVLVRAAAVPPATPMGDIVDRLLERRVHVAFGDYWHSYNLTYLSGERIKVAATDIERILEYKAIAGRPVDDISPGGVVVIQKEPCTSGGERVSGLYLCDWR